ncbi:MAG: hypothetical protein O2895_00165 [Chloroflexi bacterium]|nr:hypothetical protein [Chloroflexota bacterium]
MAEPIRKCARCRLRVQGVHPHSDGHSYCGRCLAQVEAIELAAPASRAESHEPYERAPEVPPQALDVGLEAADRGLRVTRDPQPAPAIESPAAAPIAELPEPRAEAPRSDRERAITGVGASADRASALVQTLSHERERLEGLRGGLVDELRRGEREIATIEDRLVHVTALLQPVDLDDAGRTYEAYEADGADHLEAA